LDILQIPAGKLNAGKSAQRYLSFTVFSSTSVSLLNSIRHSAPEDSVMTTTALMNTYGRLDVQFVRGEGAWLIDSEGNRYLDALAGIGVCALGHANPEISKTISEQSASLMHTSNLYRIPHQEQLADKLARISGMESAFFCNSGAEANEAAIKISRLYAKSKGISNPMIIVAEGSFHGRTLTTLTASGSRKVQAGFEPLVNGFVRAPFNDIDAIQKIAENNSSVVAVLVEPIQGEGGIQVPDDGYLKELRKLCDENEWFLILDEVQTGNARTGHYFAFQAADILPDLVTTAKGLGNGFPIGVCLAQGVAAELFQPGNHGSTFGGNPLACAVGLTVIKSIEEQNLAQRAAEVGQKMMTAFSERLSGLNCVKDIRGKGLMIGIELDSPCTNLAQQALEKGLLINVASEKVIRLLPPLIISDEQADQIVDIVCGLIEEM
jgi:acetylornithine aminotransferase